MSRRGAPESEPDALPAALLQARIAFLRDLGIFDLYRRSTGAELLLAPPSDWQQPPSQAPAPPRPDLVSGATALQAGDAHTPLLEEEAVIAARKATPLPVIQFTPGPRIARAARAGVLAALRAEIGDCTRCPLGFAGRQTVVFGDGDPNARLFFVGEGPGADEDAQGVPFVGRAGQLLNNMITAMGLAREQVYIANVVKCRPPANRVPEPVEAVTCSQFLLRQIDIVRPAVLVALGSTAATYLLGGKTPLSALRGKVHAAHGTKLIVTYHPAYLLRDPRQKKEAWTDLQLAMSELKTAGDKSVAAGDKA